MTIPDRPPAEIAELLGRQCGVLTAAAAAGWIGSAAVRWRLETRRWQQPCYGVVVTHSGPLSHAQLLWVAVLGASGPGVRQHGAAGPAALAGLTAARLDGLTGFDDQRIHVVLPATRQVRTELPAAIVVHRSRSVTPADIHPARLPPRTRLARSILDAACWVRTGDAARAVLAASVQQRLIRTDHLAAELARHGPGRRRGLISATIADIAGGAQALSELDFARFTRRHRLPAPSRQVLRRDPAGRARWLDNYWEQARLIAEIDGLWHMEAAAWWADMSRDNELTANGYKVLRFPAFAIREHPAAVAAQLTTALHLGDPGG